MRELTETWEEWHAGHCFESHLGRDCQHHGGPWKFLFDGAKEQQADTKKLSELLLEGLKDGAVGGLRPRHMKTRE